MAKYDVKEIERAKRSVLQEMFAEFGLEFDDSLKNEDLRAILYKANEEYVAPEESKDGETVVDSTKEVVEEEVKESVEETINIGSAIAERKQKAHQLKEAETPSVSLAIRNRRAGAGVGSIADAIRQRRLGKK